METIIETRTLNTTTTHSFWCREILLRDYYTYIKYEHYHKLKYSVHMGGTIPDFVKDLFVNTLYKNCNGLVTLDTNIEAKYRVFTNVLTIEYRIPPQDISLLVWIANVSSEPQQVTDLISLTKKVFCVHRYYNTNTMLLYLLARIENVIPITSFYISNGPINLISKKLNYYSSRWNGGVGERMLYINLLRKYADLFEILEHTTCTSRAFIEFQKASKLSDSELAKINYLGEIL